MIVAGVRFEIRIPMANSLKAKRAVVRPLVEALRRMASLSVSEVDHHDTWQRSAIGVAIVTPDPRSMEQLVERVRRRVDEELEIELLHTSVQFVEMES
jgi:uncharacterized protein YlxP (DUF503 family)